MQSNYLKLSTILLIFKFSIACDFQQLKTCNVMDVFAENFLEINNLRVDSLINEKKSENELYNLRFYVQTGKIADFTFSAENKLVVPSCRWVHIYIRKNTIISKEGVSISSFFPDKCAYEVQPIETITSVKELQDMMLKNVTYGPVDLNEYIPLPVRIVITKDGKYTVYISNKESVSYTFPVTFTPFRFSFRQYGDPKDRGTLFYNCTFKE